jgi:Arc/MetJ-type ribon-helix-helix transcriptional regulator
MQFFRNCANAPICDSLVREAIASGRIMNEEEVVGQALLLWEERERQRVEILGAVERAHASLARGHRHFNRTRVLVERVWKLAARSREQ